MYVHRFWRGIAPAPFHALISVWYTERVEKEMIDEYWTHRFYGYHSDDLTPMSSKYIVVQCDECCAYRAVKKSSYRELCRSCSHRAYGEDNQFYGKKHSPSAKLKMSESHKGVPLSNAHKKAMSEGGKGKVLTEQHRNNISKANKNPSAEKQRRIRESRLPTSDETKIKISESLMNHEVSNETRRKISAIQQGIPYEECDGFAKDGIYCEKFDEACRERIRAKHDYKCFVCGLRQDENITKNGKQIKLSVHHVDKNKEQGCNGHEWKLIPLCMS